MLESGQRFSALQVNISRILITKSSISPARSIIAPTEAPSPPSTLLSLLNILLITPVIFPRIFPIIPPITFSTKHSAAFKILLTIVLRILAIVSSRFARTFAIAQDAAVSALSPTSFARYLADNGTLPITTFATVVIFLSIHFLTF